jgi:energy-coupling factor transport system permease protein
MMSIYQKKDTFIHDTHPAVLLSWFISILIVSLIVDNPLYLLVVFSTMIPYVLLGRIAKEWWVIVRYVIWLTPFVLLINLMANQSGVVVLLNIRGIPVLSTIRVTLESLLFSFTMILRLVCIISSFALLSLLVNPDALFDLLLKLRLPRRSILVASITMRFIPVLLKDAYTLKESIQIRGYKLASKGFIKKIKTHSILIMPLLSSAIDRSIQIAESMEARGFSSKNKTIYANIVFKPVDISFIISSFLFIIIVIWLKVRTTTLNNPLLSLSDHVSWSNTLIYVLSFFTLIPLLHPVIRKVMVD